MILGRVYVTLYTLLHFKLSIKIQISATAPLTTANFNKSSLSSILSLRNPAYNGFTDPDQSWYTSTTENNSKITKS